MSLTDKQTEALIRFYNKQILPLGEFPEVADLEYGHPHADDPSWYVKREKTRMGKADFELGLEDEASVQAALEKMWAGTPLESMPGELMKLTRYFKGDDEDEKSGVSAFIYEMF